MNKFENLILITALLSSVVNVAHAQDAGSEQHVEISSPPSVENVPAPSVTSTQPNDLTPQIMTGGNVFDKEAVGCYAKKLGGKTYLKPIKGDKWIESNNYSTKATINGMDVYSICTTTNDGLEVVITAQGYFPQIFGAKWDSGNAP